MGCQDPRAGTSRRGFFTPVWDRKEAKGAEIGGRPCSNSPLTPGWFASRALRPYVGRDSLRLELRRGYEHRQTAADPRFAAVLPPKLRLDVRNLHVQVAKRQRCASRGRAGLRLDFGACGNRQCYGRADESPATLIRLRHHERDASGSRAPLELDLIALRLLGSSRRFGLQLHALGRL